jgi:hypothetical protein
MGRCAFAGTRISSEDGNSLAPAIAACFLMKTKGMTLKASIELILSQRGSSKFQHMDELLKAYEKSIK